MSLYVDAHRSLKLERLMDEAMIDVAVRYGVSALLDCIARAVCGRLESDCREIKGDEAGAAHWQNLAAELRQLASRADH